MLLQQEVSSWGKGRKSYPISKETLIILINAGAVIVKKNHDNHDGTFHTCATFEGCTVECSHKGKIE
jgi:hypothetical protein